MDAGSGKGVSEKKGAHDVVLQISSAQEPFFTVQQNDDPKDYSFAKNSQLSSSPKSPSLELTEAGNSRLIVQTSSFATSPSSAEMPGSSLSPNPTPCKPPRIPENVSLNRRKSLLRSEFSKPKSRLVEPPYPKGATFKEEKTQLASSSSPYSRSPNVASPSNNVTATTPRGDLRSAPITPKTPLIGSPGLETEDEDDEVYKTASLEVTKRRGKKWKLFTVVEFTAFVCSIGLLIASLTIDKLQSTMLWGLELWKWFVLVLVIFCGGLVTEWFINVLVFLIERNFLLKKKVLYFIYGLKKSVQACIWLGLILLAWGLLFNRGVKRSRHTTKVLNHITRALAACLIGAGIWLLKTFLVKLLASSFHVSRFFDRIQESIFHQYILIALSGPPVMEMAEKVSSYTATPGRLSFKNLKEHNQDKKEEVIDVDKLKKMKHGKVSAWTMKGLINVIHSTGLTTLSGTLEQSDDEDGEQKDKQITSEWEAKAAAYKIFKNVAKPGSKFIDEEDLLRFMKKEEVDNVIPLFEGTENGKIKRAAFKKWLVSPLINVLARPYNQNTVLSTAFLSSIHIGMIAKMYIESPGNGSMPQVNVYNERKSLAHSLNDTKTAIEELNKLATAFVLVVIIIVWLLLMGFLTTRVLVFISSQLLLVVFMFGNTAKTIFEAIIFVFVMHPFDVGDRCVIDGVQMVVEEMNILTTVFLRYDNEKIFYPNSVLATKPISNFYRSPEMSDTVEFAVDVSTSMETIGALKGRIKAYLESKPQHWRPSYSLQVKEIENVNKMKMALYVNHTINFQNIVDRGNRRSDLVLELKKTFEELGVKYHLLPQEVHLRYVGPVPAAPVMQVPTR